MQGCFDIGVLETGVVLDAVSDDDEVVLLQHTLLHNPEDEAAAEAAPQQDDNAAKKGSMECAAAAVKCHTEQQEIMSSYINMGAHEGDALNGSTVQAISRDHSAKPRFGPSWWDQHFKVEYGHHVTVLHIRLKAMGIGDPEVPSLCIALDSYAARMIDLSLPISIDLDVSDNELSDGAGVQILGWVRNLAAKMHELAGVGVRLRILKLFKNRLADSTCEYLAALLMALTEPIEEIHLSHNEIEQRGFIALLASLALHPKKIYPRQTRLDPCPCWVRLEHNQVADVEQLLEALSVHPAVGLRICFAPRCKEDRRPSCTSYHCSIPPESWDKVAHVHLYCVHEQSTPSNFIRETPKKLVRRCVDAASDSWSHLPVCREIGSSHAVTEVPLPKDAVLCRRATLLVDKELGAGIELEPDAYGFLVGSVEESPGQDVRPDEVILEIDGVRLWGDLDQEALEAAFGSRFGNGAQLLCCERQMVLGRPFWQPLGIDNLQARCSAFKKSLCEDLVIMGDQVRCRTDLSEEDCAVTLWGPPAAQKLATDQLIGLLRFYFPERGVQLKDGDHLPRGIWRGDRNSACEPPAAAHVDICGTTEPPVSAALAGQDLGVWEHVLRKQWSEDDDLDDDDLPCEPLEAPDDGPELFEGECIAPVYFLDRPLRMLLLTGLPGAGKSTLAARLAKKGWTAVNQDTLGDRKTCVAAARTAFKAGQLVVIDRCNISRIQRRVWLGVADEFQVGVGCIWLDIHAIECGGRVLQRFGHSTLPAEASSLGVIDAFAERLEHPMEAEGFVLWRVRDDYELQSAVTDLLDLVQRSGEESEGALAQAQATRGQGDFRYRDSSSRGARGMYLRAVRRQVEYYFSDGNMRRDWFFQEKISCEPEPGWLELRWITSCPRIQHVHKASAQDILDALGPSTLIVKEAAGVHWVRRGRPLPLLVETRPAEGEEPDWYKCLHGDDLVDLEIDPETAALQTILLEEAAGREKERAHQATATASSASASVAAGTSQNHEMPRCAACGKERPREAYSKAQLTKHRRSPTCKDCVAAAGPGDAT